LRLNGLQGWQTQHQQKGNTAKRNHRFRDTSTAIRKHTSSVGSTSPIGIKTPGARLWGIPASVCPQPVRNERCCAMNGFRARYNRSSPKPRRWFQYGPDSAKSDAVYTVIICMNRNIPTGAGE
jgi:hypothetical protein